MMGVSGDKVPGTAKVQLEYPTVEIDGWPTVDENYEAPLPLDARHVPVQWRPKTGPDALVDDYKEPVYNPDIHLDLRLPSHVFTLDFKRKEKVAPVQWEMGKDGEMLARSELALSEVLNVLSEEGVRVCREIIDRNLRYVRKCERIPAYLRGLGYTSKFMRDLNECPRLAKFVSDMAGLKLVPHTMHANYSHVNIGKVGNAKNVDSWHVDSVPYVLVSVLSDQTNSQGGALQMVKRNGREEAMQVVHEAKGNPSADDAITVAYVGPGSGLFMQGSKIMHRVTPVLNAKEPRISIVFSWMAANCFVDDTTYLDTYARDPEGMFEFTRLKAWRLMHQLRSLVHNCPYTEDPQLLAPYLRAIAQQLEHTADLITGKAKDGVGFYDETKQTMERNDTREGTDAPLSEEKAKQATDSDDKTV